MKKVRLPEPFSRIWRPVIIWWQEPKQSSSQPEVQDVCIIRASRLPTTMEQQQTDLILGYRAGAAPLLYQDTIQYHPTGVAYPSQIFGALVTEKVRSVGAQLVNARR